MFGQAAKKELCYENLKITKNAWDSNIINTNGKYLFVNWDASGGGAFAVIPLNEVGKAPDTVPLFRGHKGPVLDTAYNPFNEQQVVSCSEDGKILLWDIPEDYSFHNYVDEDDKVKELEPTKVLSGHTRKVGHVEFHPCAENVLASCSLDYTVKIWNVETGKDEITLQHKDLVTSFAFNYNGSLLATTSRDKKLRIWDIRSGKVISEGPGHTGAKPSRVVWLGNTDRILTTGFSRLSDRQVGIWDVNDIEKGPIDGFLVIDSSSGVLIPFFDESTSILYLAGKGDGNVRYYEYDSDELYELSQYASTDPQRGFACAPKIKVNLHENEILKSFKTINDHSIEPVSFIVPRKSELFQEDIYPDAPSDKPALSAAAWFAGESTNGPLLVSMEAIYDGSAGQIKESTPAVSISEKKKEKETKAATPTPKASVPSTPVQKQTTPAPKEVTPPKDKEVDEVLKSSKEVDSLLNKVVDESDDEDSKRIEESKDDDWEEVKKPVEEPVKQPVVEKKEPVKEPAAEKKEPVAEKKEPVVEKKEPVVEKKEPVVEKKEPVVEKKEPVVEKKEPTAEKKEPVTEKSTEAKEAPRAESGPSSAGQPTLRATVDKLAKLVESLEKQVTILTESGLEKNNKIELLEKKIDELLKK